MSTQASFFFIPEIVENKRALKKHITIKALLVTKADGSIS